jgi:hypothetical protein
LAGVPLPMLDAVVPAAGGAACGTTALTDATLLALSPQALADAAAEVAALHPEALRLRRLLLLSRGERHEADLASLAGMRQTLTASAVRSCGLDGNCTW